MRELDLTFDTRPTGPAPVPLDPYADEAPSRWSEMLQFAGAVALGAAILAGRTMRRRPFASALAIAFAWGAMAVGANLLSHASPHPRPLFARAAEPETTASLPLPRPTDIPPAAPAATALAAPEVAQRDRRELVRALQTELTRRGLYQGTVDGLVGPRTERAIRQSERDAGLPETGQPSERLLSKLTAPPVAAARPATLPTAPASAAATAAPSRQTMMLVQSRLADMGYAPGRLTGEVTPEFRRAIERFRKDNGLAPTAEVDRVFLERLAVVTGPLS